MNHILWKLSSGTDFGTMFEVGTLDICLTEVKHCFLSRNDKVEHVNDQSLLRNNLTFRRLAEPFTQSDLRLRLGPIKGGDQYRRNLKGLLTGRVSKRQLGRVQSRTFNKFSSNRSL